MNSFARLGAAAVICCAMASSAFADFTVTIDATALTAPRFQIFRAGPTIGPLASSTVQTLSLAESDYYQFHVAAGGFSFIFSIDANGFVQYDPGHEDFLDGAGTSLLTVVGFEFTVDATALTAPLFVIDGTKEHSGILVCTSSPEAIRGIPGEYIFRDSAVGYAFIFEIDYDGFVRYNPGHEDFLDGAGTSLLTVVGFDFTVDATALTAPLFVINGTKAHSGILVSTSSPEMIRGIPGEYIFRDSAVGYAFIFEIDHDGFVRYNPGHEDFLDGAGTSLLTVVGFDFTVDAMALTAKRFVINGTKEHSGILVNTSSLEAIRGIPGEYIFRDSAVGYAFIFEIDYDGFVRYNPGHEDFLDGAGTRALTVVGFDFTVDATALNPLGVKVDGTKEASHLFDSPTIPLAIRGIPGDYLFVETASNAFVFSLDYDGHIHYVPGHEDFLDGENTTTLTVIGFEITIDVRSVASMSSINVYGYFGAADSSVVQCIHTIPGATVLNHVLYIQWDGDGNLHSLPPVLNAEPLTGNGTPNLLLGMNTPPTADAGVNIAILPSEQNTTVLAGMTADVDCDYLTYRWYEEVFGDVLVFGPDFALDGQAPLELATLSALSVGDHTFRLEISDPFGTATDIIVVTVESSVPMLAPSGGGVFEIGPSNDVTLSATISDNDGDLVSYEWKLGSEVLFSGSVQTLTGGEPVGIPDEILATTLLGLGDHTIDLVASDGQNQSSASIQVSVMDTSMPTLSPVATPMMLFPANHNMVLVTIQANADDNSGGVLLSVSVTSSEPANFDGDGNTIPDTEIISVNSVTGEILLNLRAERSGKGNGRTYTVTITATDSSDNTSIAVLTFRAPHSKKG